MNNTAMSKWGDLGVRTASAIILIPAVLACIWQGGMWFIAFVLLLGFLVAHEWVSMVFPANPVQYALHFLAAGVGAVAPTFLDPQQTVLCIIGVAMVSAIVARFGDNATSKWSYFGIFYVGLPAVALVLLRRDADYGALAILWIFLIVWGADIFAYFAGRNIGGPKLAPRISPKKTWAGLGGAIFGSALASVLVAHFAQLKGIAALAFLAAIFAIVEQGGDLFESSLKRFHNVKDSGRLIPGHGGVIDRMDGLLFVAVIAAIIGLLRAGDMALAQGLLRW